MAQSPEEPSRLWSYLTEDLREDLMLESELLLLSFATGIQDAASWVDYGCFASNQTGNTLFLAIGAAGFGGNSNSLPNIGMSLGAFLAGGLIIGQIGHYFGARKRLWLFISSLLQTAMVYTAAAIQYQVIVSREGPAALVVLFLLAFSSGAQVALGRSLKITDITTAMATAAYIDVMADSNLLKLKNRQRNRRVGFLLMLTAGCFAGAFMERAVNSTFSIVMCAVGKTLVTFAFLFNEPIKEKSEM
ncbi:hypothetical protein PENANT_c035G06851 [Penicillium antarcticum]|uniref:DUF1275 domain protein n=1 Tax=Penicillium antarcticum TaxID=416450 RepID=A0A1V6PTZ5_9EURO|nr:uncharacterized protein N7508_009916 [Penicillium antarcticum]KAJ5295095.1 hypothetical protein N7508_009916 [Penicillium antarcticum]OQD80478.1 hypothetical protein PENANT_c035G06851 [Penicillium antarcticum]